MWADPAEDMAKSTPIPVDTPTSEIADDWVNNDTPAELAIADWGDDYNPEDYRGLTRSGSRTLPSGNTAQAYIYHTAQTGGVAVHWNDTFCDAVDCYSQDEAERRGWQALDELLSLPELPQLDPKPDSARLFG